VTQCQPSPVSSHESFLTLRVAEGHGMCATTLHYFQRWLLGLGELAGLKLIPLSCMAVPSPPM